MLSRNAIKSYLEHYVRAGQFIFLWTTEEYDWVGEEAAKLMERADKSSPDSILANIFANTGPGMIFHIKETPGTVKHAKLRYLNTNDKDYSWLTMESLIESFMFIGDHSWSRPATFYPGASTYVYIDVSPGNTLAPSPLVSGLDMMESGWIESREGDSVSYYFQQYEQCGTPPTQQDMYDELRSKRYERKW